MSTDNVSKKVQIIKPMLLNIAANSGLQWENRLKDSLVRISRDPDVAEILDDILSDRELYGSGIRTIIVEFLGSLKGDRVVSALAKRLNDVDIVCSRYAIYALGRIGDTLSTDSLIGHLESKSSANREVAVEVLGRYEKTKVLDVFEKILKEQNLYWEVKDKIIYSLSNMKGDRAKNIIEKQYRKEELAAKSEIPIKEKYCKLCGGILPKGMQSNYCSPCTKKRLADLRDKHSKEKTTAKDKSQKTVNKSLKCICHSLPSAVYNSDLPVGALSKTKRLAVKKPAVLFECKECGQLWKVDKYGFFSVEQNGSAIKISSLEEWQKDKYKIAEKDLIIKSRGGLEEELCAWMGCKNKRVRGMAICVDHMYNDGVRK